MTRMVSSRGSYVLWQKLDGLRQNLLAVLIRFIASIAIKMLFWNCWSHVILVIYSATVVLQVKHEAGQDVVGSILEGMSRDEWAILFTTAASDSLITSPHWHDSSAVVWTCFRKTMGSHDESRVKLFVSQWTSGFLLCLSPLSRYRSPSPCPCWPSIGLCSLLPEVRLRVILFLTRPCQCVIHTLLRS